MFRKKITLAVVTKERTRKLDRMLGSVLRQRMRPLKVLLIDNDPNKSAYKIFLKYKNFLPIEYFCEEKPGVPMARNRALKLVDSQYLAFADDDCVLDKNWILVAEKNVNFYPKTSYFVGNSLLLNWWSKVALAQYTIQKYWYLKKLKNGEISTPFNVDTKNIIFKVKDLKKNKISFDTNASIGWFDNADIDVGFAMKSKGLKGRFIENLYLWHEEKERLWDFIKKSYFRGRLARKVVKKWKIEGEFVNLAFLNLVTYLKSVRHWPYEYREYFSIAPRKDIFSFLLIKLHERLLLKGFLDQRNLETTDL